MTRKMLFFERFMYIDGVTPINCVMTARLRGAIDEAHLRTALDKVQAKHPLLHSRVVLEAGEPCFLIDTASPQIPLHLVDRTDDDTWQAITEAQWSTPFDTLTGPLLRVLWIRSSTAEVSELTLIAHHCICDGSSVITIIRELLQVIDKPETELVPYASYATLEDLVPSEILADPKKQSSVRRKAFLYRLFLALFAKKTPQLPTGNPYVLYWTADAEHFAAINNRCNAEDTNPYAALSVAFLQAFREVQGKASKNKIMCPVSIRRFIRSIKSDMLFAFAPTIQLSLPKEQGLSFWMQARHMKDLIGEKIDDMEVYEDLMLGDRMRPFVSRILNFLRGSRGGHDLAFSNVGRIKIPAKYQRFHLDAVIGSTVVVPWRNTNTLIMSYYLNELNLNFLSNERFLPKRDAAAIQQRALQLLQTALDEPALPSVS